MEQSTVNTPTSRRLGLLTKRRYEWVFLSATHLHFNLPAYLSLGYNFNKDSNFLKVFNACEKKYFQK